MHFYKLLHKKILIKSNDLVEYFINILKRPKFTFHPVYVLFLKVIDIVIARDGAWSDK